MRLILTRHGETIENKEGIMQGHLPGKLSEEGIEQAKKVAKRLKGEKIDYIYSSDLARAADTAKEIAKSHPKSPIKFVKELRERNMGDLTGEKKDLIFEKSSPSFSTQPKDGETLKHMYDRAERFLHHILHEHPDDSVLFVAHGGINKAIICVITNKNPEDIPSIEDLNNTSISVFDIDENKNHKIHVFNCVKHLA
jgi:broad specificity phosphatase PhoE